MFVRRVLLLQVCALCATCFAGSQTDRRSALTLEQCIAIALERNPAILSESQRHEASLARIKQATAYPYPSLEFNSDLQRQPLNFLNSGESYLGISQTIETLRKRTNRGQIADLEAREVGIETDLLKREIAFQVKQAFHALLLAKEKLQYAERDADLAKDYLQMAQLKLSAGDVAEVEVLRARVETLKAANAVKVAADKERLAKAQLKFLLARSQDLPLEIQGELQRPFAALKLEELKRESLSLRPELKRLGFSIEKQNRIQEGARLSNIPDFAMNLSRHRVEGTPRTWSFSVSVPLPFLFQQKQKAQIAEAQAYVSSLERESEKIRDTIFLEVEEAFTNAQTARNQIELYQDEILPRAQEAYDMFVFSYQEGAIGGIELIDARRTLIDGRRAYADALFDYAVALATLEKAVGRQP